jgi:hypothetical protein
MSQAYHVHPEFGWFCPSLSLRRKLRIALVTLAFLGIVGVLSLMAEVRPGLDEALAVAQSGSADSIRTNGSASAVERSGAPLEGAPSAGSVDLADIATTEVPTPAVAEPPKAPAPAPKKKRSPSQVQRNVRDFMRNRGWYDDRWTAQAYAWPNDRYSRGRYSRSWDRWSW